jgi:hypothetical protein
MPEETENTEETTEVNESTATTAETEETTPKVFDKEYVEKLRTEAADKRTKLRAAEERAAELEAKVAEFERAKLSEDERLRLELDEAKTSAKTLQDKVRESFLEAAVAKYKENELADVDATIRLMDQESVEWGADNRPSNISDVLSRTLDQYPFLKAAVTKVQKAPVDTGTTNPGRQKANNLTRESIAAMSPREIIERDAEITQWMQNGYK